MTSLPLTFSSLQPGEELLRPIRRALYHSTGPGYFIFRQFIAPELVDHLRLFWTELMPGNPSHQPLLNRNFSLHSPNSVAANDAGVTYFNGFWNAPVDEPTHAICFQMQMLRNRIETRPFYSEIYPLAGRSAMYRVVVTHNAELPVPPHTDWDGKELWDPRRLQNTLVLSKRGIDWVGKGFSFQTNQGKLIALEDEEEIEPGDLILWKYNNQHSVEDVKSLGKGSGFVRIIMPPERVAYAPARDRRQDFLRLKEKGKDLLRPSYHRLKRWGKRVVPSLSVGGEDDS